MRAVRGSIARQPSLLRTGRARHLCNRLHVSAEVSLSAMHDAIFSATATAWAFSHMKDAVRAQPPTHPDTVLRRGGTTLALPETGHLLRSEMLASDGRLDGPPRHRHIADPCRPHGSRIPRQCGPQRPRHVADQRSDRCRAHGSRIPRQGKDAGDEGDAWWRADLPALRDTPAIPLGKWPRWAERQLSAPLTSTSDRDAQHAG